MYWVYLRAIFTLTLAVMASASSLLLFSKHILSYCCLPLIPTPKMFQNKIEVETVCIALSVTGH